MNALEIKPEWGLLPGTEAGAYYRVGPDVVLAVPKPGFKQSEAAAQRSLAALDRIAREAGRKQCMVVLIDRVASQDAASRRVWSAPRTEETRCGQALVCDTLLARAIGSFFLGLSKSAIPTRMFSDLDSACAWAFQTVKDHGGRL
jgi:hypothetical protein